MTVELAAPILTKPFIYLIDPPAVLASTRVSGGEKLETKSKRYVCSKFVVLLVEIVAEMGIEEGKILGLPTPGTCSSLAGEVEGGRNSKERSRNTVFTRE